MKYSLPPSPEVRDACTDLDSLLTADINANRFRSVIVRLQRSFDIYAATCPAPFISPGLIVTPEIRIQSELYLPMADIVSAFNLLYSFALTYPPILSSTPFYKAMSWADTFVELPPYLQFSVNPALLLAKLLADRDLLTEFLFVSFLPRRFYGGFDRYPEQQKCIRKWLIPGKTGTLHCLDAACGTGEGTYNLALMLSAGGFAPEDIRIEGWTLEPLEVWAANHRRFPHDTYRKVLPRSAATALIQREYRCRITFHCRDILTSPQPEYCGRAGDKRGPFDLILCNGLLGGPIINQKAQLDRAVGNLAQLLAPGGILLAADNFHGGWKQRCPRTELRTSFELSGLGSFEAGEGIGGLKPD